MRSTKLLPCAVALVLVTVGGCIPISAHSGSDLTKLDLFKIEKNKTTEEELLQHLGQPLNTTMLADGSKQMMWMDANAQGHLNVVSALVPWAWAADQQHDTTTNRSLTATIRDGLVVDYIISNTAPH